MVTAVGGQNCATTFQYCNENADLQWPQNAEYDQKSFIEKEGALGLFRNEKKYLLVLQTGVRFACAYLRATIANKSSIIERTIGPTVIVSNRFSTDRSTQSL